MSVLTADLGSLNSSPPILVLPSQDGEPDFDKNPRIDENQAQLLKAEESAKITENSNTENEKAGSSENYKSLQTSSNFEELLSPQEVLDALQEILGHNDSLFKEVMLLATIMVKAGVRVAPESYLTKKNVLDKLRRESLELDFKQRIAAAKITEGKSAVGR